MLRRMRPAYDRLADAPAIFGKLYEIAFEQDGATYHVVVDSPDVDLQALQSMLRKITAAGVDWMQDRPYDEYTFSLSGSSRHGQRRHGARLLHRDRCQRRTA